MLVTPNDVFRNLDVVVYYPKLGTLLSNPKYNYLYDDCIKECNLGNFDKIIQTPNIPLYPKKFQSEKILDPILKQINRVLSIIIIFPVSPECVL